MKFSLKWFNTSRLVDATSDLISSKVFFIGFILLTLAYIVTQYVLPHPFDDPKADFPKLILWYTLLGLWVENLMKVYQKEQQDRADVLQEKADQQLDKMEALLELNHKETQLLHDLLQASEVREEQMTELTKANCETINKILDVMEA